MTGTLFVEVAEAGDDCILKLYRTGEAEPYSCTLTAAEIIQVMDALTRARQQITPPVPAEFTPGTPWTFVEGMRVHMPYNQAHTEGRIAFLVRHPGHGWLASAISPEQTVDLFASIMAQHARYWRTRRERIEQT